MKLRDRILSVRNLKEREVTVPEWATEESPGGLTVIVRELTGAERYKMANSGNTGGSTLVKIGRATFEALIWCVLDPETHSPLFEPADLDTLMNMSSTATDRLRAAMYELSGLTPEPIAAAEKN